VITRWASLSFSFSRLISARARKVSRSPSQS